MTSAICIGKLLVKMVVSCWVKGCTNRAGGDVHFRFFHIPSIRTSEGEETKKLSEERRRAWLANINRKDAPSASSRICSDHFINGSPAYLYDRASPDWAPTLKLDTLTPRKSIKKMRKADTDFKRYNRAAERQKTKEKHLAARALLDLFEEPSIPLDPVNDETTPPDTISEKSRNCDFKLQGPLEKLDYSNLPKAPVTKSQVDSEMQRLLSENMALREKLNAFQFSQESFMNNDEKVRYYTGLPNYLTLIALFELVGEYIPNPKNSDIGNFERLVMTLMRLKLNLPVQDLAYRFSTSAATVSRTFLIVIHVLYVKLEHLLYWPTREELRETMPMEFRKSFGQKTAVIIDCFEIFIQRPKNLMARAQTWSSYKHNNTVKFLIGITPQGSISFLSNAWGGRASDKYITENSGLLDNLLPGDLVLADRGFDISDSVGMCCAQVNIPAFTKGKSQLSPVDIETTRKIAHVRIHEERVIGLVRNKYTMLQDKLPVDFLMCDEGQIPVVDKIVTVACALTNMCDSVVSFN